MTKKTVEKSSRDIEVNGKNITVHFMEDQYTDEAITDNLCDSISDFYNMMHLIEHSWTNKKYQLKIRDAGCDIYNKDGEVAAWIGIHEKSDCLRFMIYCFGTMWRKAEKNNKGPITIYDYDEDWWLYSELNLGDILKEKTEEGQRKIVEDWINKTIKKLL
jgi:hypothetical protein